MRLHGHVQALCKSRVRVMETAFIGSFWNVANVVITVLLIDEVICVIIVSF